MRRAPFFIVLMCLIPLWGKAELDSIPYLAQGDSVFLYSEGMYGYYTTHTIKPSQTVYSLCKFYGIYLEDFYVFNPEARKGVDLWQEVKVPLPKSAINRYLKPEQHSSDYVPIYYVVKKGDTMYGISNRFVKMPMDTIMQRNHLMSYNLHDGQKLFIGWMNINGLSEVQRKHATNPLVIKNKGLRDHYFNAKGSKKERQEQGPAFWNKEQKAAGGFYVLHRKAKLNSVIAVTNPMNNMTVYAKVVGRIDDRVHGYGIKVVLSPLAAKLLGAVDERFFVKIKYY